MRGGERFVEECEALGEKYGKRFEPTEGLKEMAAKGGKFYS